MQKIPVHKLSEKFQGELAMIRYISKDDIMPNIKYAHKDDYYIFLLVEGGKGKFLIDFKEYEVIKDTVYCILPGQIHFPAVDMKGSGWMLAVDRMFVKDEYKEIFEKVLFVNNQIKPENETMQVLRNFCLLVQKRLRPEREPIEQSVAYDLISSYIGMIAEMYQKEFSATVNKRYSTITSQFKNLLSENYTSLKRPSEYASKLNLSAVYLNEAVKNTTGLTVSECIQAEIITQAKRLLFHTNMSVKEIALALGYEDWAYFTRLFTKATSLSPTRFRKKYLK